MHGFHTRPAFFQAYNPPYYPPLLEQCGYAVKYKMSTWEFDLSDEILAGLKPFLDAGDRVAASGGMSVRPVDIRHFDRDMESVRLAFNEAFASYEEIVPFERDVFHVQVRAASATRSPADMDREYDRRQGRRLMSIRRG